MNFHLLDKKTEKKIYKFFKLFDSDNDAMLQKENFVDCTIYY